MQEIKRQLIEKIKEYSGKNKADISVGQLSVFWNRNMAYAETEDCLEGYFISEKESELSDEEIVNIVAKKYKVSKDKVGFSYSGRIDYYSEKDIHCLEFYQGYAKLEYITDSLLKFIDSKAFDSAIETANKRFNLSSSYKNKSEWIKSDKLHEDNEYVAIVRIDDTNAYYNELFDYIESNHKDNCYNIYQAREDGKVMYIAKNELLNIASLIDNDKMKDDIDRLVKAECNCSLCGNTLYVNTHPYVYDGYESIGRLYACPICLDLHDLSIHPTQSNMRNLNGDEKMDLLDFAYNRALELFGAK